MTSARGSMEFGKGCKRFGILATCGSDAESLALGGSTSSRKRKAFARSRSAPRHCASPKRPYRYSMLTSICPSNNSPVCCRLTGKRCALVPAGGVQAQTVAEFKGKRQETMAVGSRADVEFGSRIDRDRSGICGYEICRQFALDDYVALRIKACCFHGRDRLGCGKDAHRPRR